VMALGREGRRTSHFGSEGKQRVEITKGMP
jgi:hypothetical protein